MNRKTLDQALTERREVHASAEAERLAERNRASVRYVELITSGSGVKADVDELLKVAELLGKSEAQLDRDIGNIEAAKGLVGDINALAGADTARRAVSAAVEAVGAMTQDAPATLQRQYRVLLDLQGVAGDRSRRLATLFVELDHFKAKLPELLSDVAVPDRELGDAARDPREALPELDAWAKAYVEPRPVSFNLSNETPAN